jgi:hypothetical protein
MKRWHSELVKSLETWSLPYRQANLNIRLMKSKKIHKVL